MAPIDICNVALARIGNKRITSLTATDATSKACALLYEPTRDEVLRSHRWNFAEKRQTLSVLADDTPLSTWEFAYQLPSDFLRLCEVNDSEIGEGDDWKVEGETLLSDESPVTIVYVWRIEDSEKFDPIFCEALALKLATKLIAPLRGNTAQIGSLGEEYLRITAPAARRIDSNESRSKGRLFPLRSTFIAARYRGGNALVPWTEEPS